ncbi:hypothetical protein ILYODFUR_019886 [Ilyodon furcidens]|uniref:Uncharacterized protein n=1 Tax=Ilyodon furcidens TaxID=33524 RepID=A0ABV0VFI2_9TELE
MGLQHKAEWRAAGLAAVRERTFSQMPGVHRVQREVPAGVFYKIQDLQVRRGVHMCVYVAEGDGEMKRECTWDLKDQKLEQKVALYHKSKCGFVSSCSCKELLAHHFDL